MECGRKAAGCAGHSAERSRPQAGGPCRQCPGRIAGARWPRQGRAAVRRKPAAAGAGDDGIGAGCLKTSSGRICARRSPARDRLRRLGGLDAGRDAGRRSRAVCQAADGEVDNGAGRRRDLRASAGPDARLVRFREGRHRRRGPWRHRAGAGRFDRVGDDRDSHRGPVPAGHHGGFARRLRIVDHTSDFVRQLEKLDGRPARSAREEGR